MDSHLGGHLTIKVLEGKLTRDVQTFGKQDPFVLIKYMGTEHKTHVHENGGKTPAWGDSFEVNLGSVSDELTFEVRDDEVMSSRIIGVMHVKGSALAINGGVREWFTIYHDDKSAGEVHLETHFKPNK